MSPIDADSDKDLVDALYVSSGEKIVLDGLLCFMVHKMLALNQDALEKLVVSAYPLQAIRASKEKLYKLCSDQRNVSHTGDNAATKHVRDMIKLLQEKGKNIPTFVSDAKSLSAMPPVTFNSMDVVSLLRRIQTTQEEVAMMRMMLTSQNETMDNMSKTTVEIAGRLSSVETVCTHLQANTTMPDMIVSKQDAPSENVNSPPPQDPEDTLVKEGAPGPLQKTFTEVVRSRRQRKKTNPKPSANKAHAATSPASDSGQQSKPRQAKKIIGTANEITCGLKSVKTKLIKVFVTGLVRETSTAELENHLQRKLKNDTVKCELIKKGERASSFCVSAECRTADDLYDPALWPEGSYVRRFYTSRNKPKSSNSQ